MAVPKKKTSVSRRNTRRASNYKIKRSFFIQKEKNNNISHHICEKSGYYNRKKILNIKEKKRKRGSYTDF